MRSPHSFLVEPLNDRRYDNSIKIGDIDFITSSSKEDHKASNRFAKVVNTPIGYSGDIVPGDILLVHHNVFKFYNDIKGVERSGKSYLFDNIFLIDSDQYFMYKHNDQWFCDGMYSFVEPVKAAKSEIDRNIVNETLTGSMVYLSDYAKSQGLSEGDHVIFSPDSEYEFRVDGRLLYRIYDIHLTVKK